MAGANFFKSQREQIRKSQFDMAVELGLRASSTIGAWENEKAIPRLSIAQLAKAYGVSESKMEREVMALRRRIEAREEAAAK